MKTPEPRAPRPSAPAPLTKYFCNDFVANIAAAFHKPAPAVYLASEVEAHLALIDTARADEWKGVESLRAQVATLTAERDEFKQQLDEQMDLTAKLEHWAAEKLHGLRTENERLQGVRAAGVSPILEEKTENAE